MTDLDEMRAAARELEALAERLNARIAEAEQRILDTGLRITAWISLPVPIPGAAEFGWARFGDAWRIGVVRHLPTAASEPLANASLEVRLACVQLLPELERRVLAVARDRIERMRAVLG